jgi:hypothetical protein
LSGLLDTQTAEDASKTIKDNKVGHSCASAHKLFLGETEAEIITSYDSDVVESLKNAGVKIENLTIADLEKVGALIDEVNANLKTKGSTDFKFLYKHSIAARLDYELLAIKGCFFEGRLLVCSKIFGNKVVWF